MKTQIISGHEITLKQGLRYYASRPIAKRSVKQFPISIKRVPTIRALLPPESEAVIKGLTYDQANEFLAAFNNVPTSFDGRIW